MSLMASSAPFLNVPPEIHLAVFAFFDSVSDILSLQYVSKYFHNIFKRYLLSICRSIALPRPTHHYINLMRRSDLAEQQAFLIRHQLNTGKADWAGDRFRRDVCGTLSPDLFSFRELVALFRFEDVMVRPYIECLQSRCLPKYILSSSELDRIEKAIINIYSVVRHVHSVKLAEPKKPYYEIAPPGYVNEKNVLLRDEIGEIIIEDDFFVPAASGTNYPNNKVLGVLDARGFMEEFSIEEHMHMVSVLELLSYHGLYHRRSYSWDFVNKLPELPLETRLFRADFNLPDYLGWLLNARLVDTWSIARAELEPKNWISAGWGSLEHVARRRVNTIIRDSVYDFGQDRLVEFVNGQIPKYGFGAMTLQKSSFNGAISQLVLAPYDESQLREVTGRIWIDGALEERSLLVPDIERYGGRLLEGSTFGRRYSISKRAHEFQ